MSRGGGETPIISPIVSTTQDGDILESGLKAGLKDRMINLIALCGIIGPGCLIGMGNMLAEGGPVGMIVGYAIVGLLVMSMCFAIGEMNSFLDFNFSIFGSRYISKGFGATLSLYYAFLWICTLISEYTALTASLTTYTDKIPTYGWFLLMWAFFTVFQTLGVEAYGEAEYILGFTKIAFLSGFYIFAIIYAAGGIPDHKPDNPFKNYPLNSGFKGIANSFVYAAQFYSGVEAVSIIAAESRNPRRAIPTAVKNTVIRIFFVYFGLSISYGITVAYNNPNLTSSAKVLKSPITIALTEAGWINSKYFVTTFILLVCLSSINSAIYLASRALFSWSNAGFGPRIFTTVNKSGVPYVAIHTCHLFGFLSILSYKSGSSEAYSYIIGLSGVAAFITWTAICITHLRFRYGLIKQNYDLKKVPFLAPFFPYASLFATGLGIVLILVQGWTVFKPFHAGLFVDAYILLPLFPIIWFLYDFFYFKQGIIKFEDMDFETGKRADLDAKDDVEEDLYNLQESKSG
ncbi:hypothetical protein CANARDRAFT_30774 [[Candida] arabinofermentans NRRL YB-2248]|uniref:Amino acid permease/ SLC12A domain-containing protein n=1 Tax=[Candida] arabinofermentans NRRL YB-2248 TaxID=983967 RepID=A0A1E4SSL9_9ASCO|nr:hypothetical protein CANARDRAFT_30774 [[Candida] arabinofermentans NRRL YB-2248]